MEKEWKHDVFQIKDKSTHKNIILLLEVTQKWDKEWGPFLYIVFFFLPSVKHLFIVFLPGTEVSDKKIGHFSYQEKRPTFFKPFYENINGILIVYSRPNTIIIQLQTCGQSLYS